MEEFGRQVILDQIGCMNVLAISGGRWSPLPDGVELPVSQGYRVRVRLTPSDDYTVERLMVRGGREFAKGTKERVYCDQVGEVAYRASCYRSYGEGVW